MRKILEKLYEGGVLTTDEAFQVMTDIGEGRGSNEVLASLLIGQKLAFNYIYS